MIPIFYVKIMEKVLDYIKAISSLTFSNKYTGILSITTHLLVKKT